MKKKGINEKEDKRQIWEKREGERDKQNKMRIKIGRDIIKKKKRKKMETKDSYEDEKKVKEEERVKGKEKKVKEEGRS